MAPSEAATPPPAEAAPSRWFWPNLLLLALLAPLATWWFRQHLELYLTEIVVIGGGLSVWVALRAAVALVQKLGKLDPLSLSRRALGSPETSLLLLVALALMAWLWFTTNSLYFQYEGGGGGEREFVVQVNRVADGTPFMPDVTVGPAAKVAGQAFLLRGEAADLECRIVKPLLFEPLRCPIALGEAKRVRVPGGFKPRAFHLLRIVPMPALYDELPDQVDQPAVRYDLELTLDGVMHRFKDWRRQTLYAGGQGADMPLVLGLHDAQVYERTLGSALRAMSVDEASSGKVAAVLALRAVPWDAIDARSGQRLRFALKRIERRDGQETTSEVEGFPSEYLVTADKAQTVWIPTPR